MTDVARLAGVSAQTVSRTLAGHPHVRPETRARVLAAVGQLSYRRNNAARALSSGRSRTIGVVTLRTTFASRAGLALGVETAARAAGYAVSGATTASPDAAAVTEALTRLVDQGVEGVVLCVPLVRASPALERLTRAVPTVTVDGARTAATEVVAVDQAQVARLATRHLTDLGHESVWHVAGPGEWLDASARRTAWQDALRERGLTAPPVLEGDWTPESGYRNGLLLGRIPEATAVFAASDEMAFGVIRALRELGRRVPEDVSVVGVDDIALAAYCAPGLTTVAQPFTAVGALAVARLLRRVGGAAEAAGAARPEPVLVVRASTAPAARPGARTARRGGPGDGAPGDGAPGGGPGD
ncbi:LacI family DNA-binding transcriptional regulator [Streptomyces sp. NPDC052077]|uniref:LacI family DNA-binding transcriptional regulator n=1 Tax=Streptomyces sp. NPDC052077 TaxID=3154757 RepID=UPI0034408DFC